AIVAAARANGVNLRVVDDDTVAAACDEATSEAALAVVADAFGVPLPASAAPTIPDAWARREPFLTHPVFHEHRSETQLLRYLRALADKDFALDRGMIPLGSCTMKLNATAEMEPVTWPELAGIHPFAPADQTEGYVAMIRQLEGWLADITGYDAVSVQPNAGSQGQLA